MLWVTATVWLLFLVLAVPYTRTAKHAKVKPLAAYLIFVLLFTAVSFVLFAGLSWLLIVTGQTALLDRPLGALVFLALVFVPAFVVARWQLRQPPKSAPPPD